MICITRSHITTYTQIGVSRPILTNILYTTNQIYPITLVYSHVSQFSLFHRYSVHSPEFPKRSSSVSLYYTYPHNAPGSPSSKETTRLHWRVSCTQHRSSYLQGLMIGYGPTKLLYSPYGGNVSLDSLRT